MEKVSNKEFFTRYGIFAGFLAVVFGLLVYVTLSSRKSWNNNLKVAVEKVLDDVNPNQWSVGNNVPIKNPMKMNASCYEARNIKDGTLQKAVILRTATLYGPQAAVFLYDDNNVVTFVGYSSLHGRINEEINYALNDKRIEYWQKKLPEILE